MTLDTRFPFITLLMLISFASVNAVLFTPALPSIADFFSISTDSAQLTITWFLIGYTLGQIIYGPITNRYGRKPALYFGIGLEIISSLVCVLAGIVHQFWLLIAGRFFLALGSGVGLKMTFTLVNEWFEPIIASQKISYLMLAFAITPGLGVALGGILNTYFGWMSCFYASAIYGFILLLLVIRLPGTECKLNLDAFKIKNLIFAYSNQFKNKYLVSGGFLMGCSTAFIYVFAALAPFIAINFLDMTSYEYGIANILPPIGLMLGSICSANLTKYLPLKSIILTGLAVTSVGILLMSIAIALQLAAIVTLFLPMIVIYFGLSLVLANASTIAMSNTIDKAHGSAVMNFINMGTATIAVLTLGFFHTTELVLPLIFIILCTVMLLIYKFVLKFHN